MSLKRLGKHLLLVAVCVAVLYPVLWVLRMAVSPQAALSASLTPLPEAWTLDNFRRVVGTHDLAGRWLFGRQLANSLVVAVATTLVSVFLATTAGYAFSRFRFPGRRAGMTLFLVTQMFPAVMMAVPLYLIMDALDLLDRLPGLVLVYGTSAIPFCVWMLKGYFDTIPVDLEEAAAMDGASRFTIFYRVVLPLAKPAVAVTALFAFMTAWNEYILAATFMSQETAYTLPVALQGYVGTFSTDWGAFAAGAVIVSLPVMLLFYALQQHLVGGLTAGGVKG